MTLPASGTISFDQVRTELGIGGAISMADVNTRVVAGKLTAGSTISFTDFYNVKVYTVTVGQNSTASAWGWDNRGLGYGAASPTTYKGLNVAALFHGTTLGNVFESNFTWGFGANPVPPSRMTNYRSHNTLNTYSGTTAQYNAGGGNLFDSSNIGGVYKVAVKEQ